MQHFLVISSSAASRKKLRTSRKKLSGTDRAVADNNRRYARIRFRLPRATRQKPRSQTIEARPEHPGGALGLTYRRHLSMGVDYREEGVARLVISSQPPVGPLVPLLRRPARGYETPLVTGSDAG